MENNKNREVVEQFLKEKDTFAKIALLELRSARSMGDISQMKLPEEISLKFNMTLRELVDKIRIENNPELEKEWILYREALKVKFAKSDRETMKDMQSNYQLGIDSKSFPDIGFYFGENERMEKALEAIIVQTQLQREKNIKEAKSMGIDILTNKEQREFENVIEGLDFDD